LHTEGDVLEHQLSDRDRLALRPRPPGQIRQSSRGQLHAGAANDRSVDIVIEHGCAPAGHVDLDGVDNELHRAPLDPPRHHVPQLHAPAPHAERRIADGHLGIERPPQRLAHPIFHATLQCHAAEDEHEHIHRGCPADQLPHPASSPRHEPTVIAEVGVTIGRTGLVNCRRPPTPGRSAGRDG
jgi:hypothetical protein